MTVQRVALDGGWEDTAEAELAPPVSMAAVLGARDGAAEVGGRVLSACTHFMGGDRPRVVVTVELVGGPGAAPAGGGPALPGAAPGVEALVEAHASRVGGRVFAFPGREALTGVLTVCEILAMTAIDDVVVIGGGPPSPHLRVDTQEFVRPHFVAGRLVLHTRPAASVGLVPFEQPEQTPCCTDHATRSQRAAASSATP